MSMWLKFEDPCNCEAVYLSNGGHRSDSHGVAMLYDRGKLEMRFRRKNGEEWRASSDNVLPGRWYHVTAAWSRDTGLSLYVDGRQMENNLMPTTRSQTPSRASSAMADSFIIGRPNENNPSRESGTMLVDEFHFWSKYKTADEVRETGELGCLGGKNGSLQV